MLIIRFYPVGKKHQRSFRIVVTEKSFSVKGKFLELLGSYNPHLKKANLNKERINYWISKGAKISDSVWNLLIREKVIKGEKRPKRIKKRKKKESAQKEEKGEELKEKEQTEEQMEKKTEEKSEEKEEEKSEEKEEDKNT
mgnify:CR=1 FL=1